MANSPIEFECMTVRKPAPPVTRIDAVAKGRPSAARSVPSIAPVVTCENRAPGTKAVANRKPKRRTPGRLRLLLEHGGAAERVPKSTSHKCARPRTVSHRATELSEGTGSQLATGNGGYRSLSVAKFTTGGD